MKPNFYTYLLSKLALLILLITIFTSTTANKAFAKGEPGRYLSPIFPVVNITPNVLYAQNKDLNGQTVDLMVDIYQPAGDTQARRPLIIYLHHGSFQNGTRGDSEAVILSRYFAQRGYVTASLSYRLGINNLLNPQDYAEAIFRATQDARSGIRFFRANAAKYGIDTSRIYIGGASAGSITSIHAAYLTPARVPQYMDTSKLGGLDAGGNPGFSAEVDGIVNLFGGILDTNWITSAAAPIVSVHGEDDPTVPYRFANFGIFSLYGSFNIHKRAENLGIKNRLQSFPNTGHGFEPEDSGKVDTTFRVIREFLYALASGHDTIITSVEAKHLNNNSNTDFAIYPNPASDHFNLVFENSSAQKLRSVTVYTINGQAVLNYNLQNMGNDQLSKKINLPVLPTGLYIVKTTNVNGEISTRKLSIQQLK